MSSTDNYDGVDLDVLADYVGGVLRGTVDEERIAELVASEAAWRDAYTSLRTAVERVSLDLSQLTVTTPMPFSIAYRIEESISRAGNASSLGRLAERGPTRPLRSSRPPRRRGLVASLAVAASLVTILAFGAVSVFTDSGANDTPTNAIQADGSTQPVPPFQGRPTISGKNYSANTIVEQAREAAGSASVLSIPLPSESAKIPPSARMKLDDGALSTNPALGKFENPSSLTACLIAIMRTHSPAIEIFDSVELALYEGVPAVIAFFTDRSGSRHVRVAGVNCGESKAGADTLFSGKAN